jgi:hypothetical protein
MTDHDEVSAETLSQQYERLGPPLPAGLAVPPKFAYLRFKAFCYLTLGPTEYRRQDALSRPPADWNRKTLAAVRRGCEQIVAWRGTTAETALEGLGVQGFYALIALFHFQVLQQSASFGEGLAMDRMVLEHEVTGAHTILFNQVSSCDWELAVP